MKKITLFLLIIQLCCVSVWAQQGKYDVNFNNMTMKEFITFVASFTDTNIVYKEADLKGNVSVASQYPMTSNDIMEIFHAVLNTNGLYAVQEGDYLRIVPDKDMAILRDDFVDRPSDEEFVTTFIMLKRYNAVAIANTLNRARSKYGIVEPLRGVNAVLVKDFGERIEKMRKICELMDSYAGEYQLHSITLQNSKASRVEQQITRFFAELIKNAIGGSTPIVISDDFSNVLLIAATADDYSKIEFIVAQVDSTETGSSVLPRVYYLKYSNAEDVEKVLNKLILGTQTAAPQSAQTVQSQISFDKGTNSIIAIGDQYLYANIESMIDKIDIPRRQVYVEALILETSIDESSKFGVEWFGAGAQGDGFGFVNSGSSGSLTGIVGSIAAGTSPLSGMPGGFSAGLIGNVISYNGITFPSLGAFMSALTGDSGINIVSNPQILTLDNEDAEVFVGENRPYMTSEKYDTNNNAIQTFDYRDVGIRLKVTPHIAGDDMVTLDIEQEVNKISPATFNDAAPVTLTRTTKTKVQLYDRSIMVISGLMKDDSSISNSGIPFLRRIPILGWLFKTETKTSEKTNLMVFITTYIIETKDDMYHIMDRRANSTQQFNDEARDSGAKEIMKDQSTYIPMMNDFEGGIGMDEEEAEAVQ